MPDNALIRQIAAQRAMGAASLQLAWENALSCLPELPGPGFELVALALPGPDCARHFGRFLARDPDPARSLAAFLREVDESDETLEEWLAAFEVLALFLDSTPHRPSLSQALGYLHCCAAVSHTGARYASFPMTVETMLETYGYSGEQA